MQKTSDSCLWKWVFPFIGKSGKTGGNFYLILFYFKPSTKEKGTECCWTFKHNQGEWNRAAAEKTAGGRQNCPISCFLKSRHISFSLKSMRKSTEIPVEDEGQYPNVKMKTKDNRYKSNTPEFIRSQRTNVRQMQSKNVCPPTLHCQSNKEEITGQWLSLYPSCDTCGSL